LEPREGARRDWTDEGKSNRLNQHIRVGPSCQRLNTAPGERRKEGGNY